MRDDFSSKVKDTLAKRVAHRCSNPSCRALTSGPRTDPDRALSIGVAAHISAASPGGPRFNARLTKAQRTSILNAIWLCQNCAKLIDSDAVIYPTEVLLRWRWQAEDIARKTLGSSDHPRPSQQDRHIQMVLQSCVQRGVIIILGRAIELALDHSLLQNLDDIVESTLRAGLQRGGRQPSLPYRSAIPDLSSVLNGVVTEENYYAVREKLYSTIDRSEELRGLARRHVENLPFPILTNITRQITSLMAAGTVKGVVQMNPVEAIERHIEMSTRCTPEYYRNGAVVAAEPFVLNLGLDASNLPIFHLRNSGISRSLGPYLKRRRKPRPVIVAINMSPIDSEMLSKLSTLSEARTDIFIIGGQVKAPAPQIVCLSINPIELISKLDAAVTPQASLFRFCRTLEFRGPPSITRIVNSEKLQPDDAKIAMVPCEIEDDLQVMQQFRRVPIDGHAGDGKSTRAFLLCYELFKQGHSIFFLPLSELHGNQVDLHSLIALISDLASLNPKSVLLIDDMHLFPGLHGDLRVWLDQTRDVSRPYVILVETLNYTFSDMVGGQIAPLKEAGGKHYGVKRWQENRRRLGRWVQEQSEALSEEWILITAEALERCENSQNPWHFFYLLRGGYEGLLAAVSAARVRNRADIVWFSLALLYAVGKERPYVTWEVLDTIQKHSLLPSHIPQHLAHIWVSESIHALLSARLIVSEGEGVAPRHKLESAMLVRNMLAAEHGMKEACRSALLGILTEFVPRISLPPSSVEDLIHGDKFRARQVIYRRIQPTIDAVVSRQIALIRFPELRDFFHTIWKEFIEAIASTDIHHLYCIVNAINEFSTNTFVYSPFEYCVNLKRVSSLRTISDAIDLSIFLKSVIGAEGLRQIEFEYQMRLIDYELHLNLQMLLRVRQAANTSLENDSSLSSKEKRALRDLIKKLTTEIDHTRKILGPQDENKTLSRLPAAPTKDDIERLAVEDTAALLQAIENRRNSVAHVADLIDSTSVAKFMRGVKTPVGFMVLASLWLVSPAAAGHLYDSLSSAQIRKLEERVIKGKSYSDFHLSRNSLVFHLFLHWLGTKNKRIARYYDKFCADETNSAFRERLDKVRREPNLPEHDSADVEFGLLSQVE